MIAAIYTQEEVDTYFTMKKYVENAEWTDAFGNQLKRQGRINPGETKIHIALSCDNPDLLFSLELCRSLEIDSVNILLHVQQGSRTSQAICRYDIHDSIHVDGLATIDSRTPHIHRYSQSDYERTRRWDRFAVIIKDIRADGSGQQVFDRLKNFVLDDLRICFYDRDERNKYRLF